MFVVQSNSDFVGHSEKCKEKRAVHVASSIPFSCEHCNLLKSFSSPTLAKNLTEDDIKSYKCDNTTQRMLTGAIQPPDDLRHVVEFLKVVMLYITVLPRAYLTPWGIVMCRREMDFSAARTRAVQRQVV